jgi:hypothetical protein
MAYYIPPANGGGNLQPITPIAPAPAGGSGTSGGENSYVNPSSLIKPGTAASLATSISPATLPKPSTNMLSNQQGVSATNYLIGGTPITTSGTPSGNSPPLQWTVGTGIGKFSQTTSSNLNLVSDVGTTGASSPQIQGPTHETFSIPDFGSMTTGQNGLTNQIQVTDFPTKTGPLQINPNQTSRQIPQQLDLQSQNPGLLKLTPDIIDKAKKDLGNGIGLGSGEGTYKGFDSKGTLKGLQSSTAGQAGFQISGHENSGAGLVDLTKINGKTSNPFKSVSSFGIGLKQSDFTSGPSPSDPGDIETGTIIQPTDYKKEFWTSVAGVAGAAVMGGLTLEKTAPLIATGVPGAAVAIFATTLSTMSGYKAASSYAGSVYDFFHPKPKDSSDGGDPTGGETSTGVWKVHLMDAQFGTIVAQSQDNTKHIQATNENNVNDMPLVYLQGQINKNNYIGGFHGQSSLLQGNGFGSIGEGFDVGSASYQTQLFPNLMPSTDPNQQSAEDMIRHAATNPIINPNTGA